MRELLRQIPPVHEIKQHPTLQAFIQKEKLSDKLLTTWIQRVVNDLRDMILKSSSPINDSSNFTDYIVSHVHLAIKDWEEPNLKKVLNGTGTVLHTNFGRARLSEDAISQVIEAAKGYSNLEYDLQAGKRGSRHQIIESLIKEVTGAEAAMVVNNNAASVYLILRAFARGKKVIVSRGELVEIGGSFRVSSIMEESDAYLSEVGTTNKTHRYDYKQAIQEDTSMIMKVHTSNFKIVGFTESVERNELIPMCNENNLIYYEDLGSGALFDFKSNGIGQEPLVKDVIKSGADIVSFSGDKLLGGPQAGIIAGKKSWIDQLKKHQLARVLRVDKMTLAALEATLKAYVKSNEDLYNIPTIRDIMKSEAFLKDQTFKFVEKCVGFKSLTVTAHQDTSMIGGGTMPDVTLPTYGILLKQKTVSVHHLERNLRNNTPPVIGRFIKNGYFLDFRTLTEEEIKQVYLILQRIDQSSYMS